MAALASNYQPMTTVLLYGQLRQFGRFGTASDCNVPSSPGAVGVVHAARRARLDPAHAQRVIGITYEGDQGLITLQACQAYVRAISHR